MSHYLITLLLSFGWNGAWAEGGRGESVILDLWGHSWSHRRVEKGKVDKGANVKTQALFKFREKERDVCRGFHDCRISDAERLLLG